MPDATFGSHWARVFDTAEPRLTAEEILACSELRVIEARAMVVFQLID